MPKYKEIIKHNFILLTLSALFWIIAGILLIKTNKIQLHIFLNTYHSHFADTFFKYITFLGNGFWFIILIFLVYLLKKEYFSPTLVYGIILLIIIQFLKHIFHLPRPMAMFENMHIHIEPVQGVRVLKNNSFPSGHTATAFAIAFVISTITNKHYIQLLTFIFALLIAYSRIYLHQHFFIDVCFSSFISIFTGVIIFSLYNNEANSNNLSRFRKRLSKRDNPSGRYEN